MSVSLSRNVISSVARKTSSYAAFRLLFIRLMDMLTCCNDTQFYMEDCGISPPMPEDAPLGSPGYKPWAYDEEGERQLWTDSLAMLKLKDDQ